MLAILAALVLAQAPSPDAVATPINADSRRLSGPDRRLFDALVAAARSIGPQEDPWPADKIESLREVARQARASQRPDLAAGLDAAATAASHPGQPAPQPFGVFTAGGLVVVTSIPQRDGKPIGPRLDLGIACADHEPWLREITDRADEFERSLPRPEGALPRRGPRAAANLVADLAIRAGAAADSAAPQTIVGTSPDRRFVFWRNVIESTWFVDSFEPAARLLLDDESQKLITPASLTRWYALRFAMYGIGPDTCTGPDGTPVAVRDRLGDAASPISIALADVLATHAADWLSTGREPRPLTLEQAREVNALLLVERAVTAHEVLAGRAPPQHGPASLYLLERALELNSVHQSGRRWSITLSGLGAWQRTARDLLAISARGDAEAARALVERYAKPSAPLAEVLNRLDTIPPVRRTLIYNSP